MGRHFAQIEDNQVTKVIVGNSLDWVQSRFSGLWVETFKKHEYKIFAAEGMFYDPASPFEFANHWKRSFNSYDMDAKKYGYQVGQIAWYKDRIWQSAIFNNPWRPDLGAWFSHENQILPWLENKIYLDNSFVFYNNRVWKSFIDNNTNVPGEDGWQPVYIDIELNIDQWEPFKKEINGTIVKRDHYNIDKIVKHNGVYWISTKNNNLGIPGEDEGWERY